MKELSISVHICQSYCKNRSGTFSRAVLLHIIPRSHSYCLSSPPGGSTTPRVQSCTTKRRPWNKCVKPLSGVRLALTYPVALRTGLTHSRSSVSLRLHKVHTLAQNRYACFVHYNVRSTKATAGANAAYYDAHLPLNITFVTIHEMSCPYIIRCRTVILLTALIKYKRRTDRKNGTLK